MITRIIKDIYDNPYYAIDVLVDSVDNNGTSFNELLNKFLELVPNAVDFNNKLLKRNSNAYHITILNVPEYNIVLKSNEINELPTIKIDDIVFKGIGSITDSDMVTYYVVVDSLTLNLVRGVCNMKQKDLHITIGFSDKDLFKKRKNVTNVFTIE